MGVDRDEAREPTISGTGMTQAASQNRPPLAHTPFSEQPAKKGAPQLPRIKHDTPGCSSTDDDRALPNQSRNTARRNTDMLAANMQM